MTDIHTQRIAKLNDVARRAMGIACRVFITEGIRQLPWEDQSVVDPQSWTDLGSELVKTVDVAAANQPHIQPG